MPSVTTIGMYAFSGTGLTEISFPSCLSVIGRYAFSGSALISLSLPKTVEKIGDYAFEGCTSLVSVKVEDGITSIPVRVFSGCTALTDLSLPSSLKKIDEYAFCLLYLAKGGTHRRSSRACGGRFLCLFCRAYALRTVRQRSREVFRSLRHQVFRRLRRSNGTPTA